MQQGRMLFSKENNKYATIDSHKVSKGQFNTVSDIWLRPQISAFIKSTKKTKCLDPFAGKGDLLSAMSKSFNLKTIGLDIDSTLPWKQNDSLINIPAEYKDFLIVTNPPYLANYSAKRKRVSEEINHYYHKWNDLYMQALDVCLENNDYVVAIVPETFLNSNYPKEHCKSISIIVDNPFTDTDCPVCVLCMTKKKRSCKDIDVYINDDYVSSLFELKSNEMTPNGLIDVKFNDVNGNIGLRAVDLTGALDKIKFLRGSDLGYDRSKIKVSSRLVTYLSVFELKDSQLDDLIEESNLILTNWRRQTQDILLSPFKGNAKDGKRRRRLDYRTARAIMEQAYCKINKIKIETEIQEFLF